MDTIDLRSDTITRPTDSMRQAMARAAVGDDGYGEDPTVNRLQEIAAEQLGKEAALFTPSGTMANLVALLTHTGRGGAVVLEETSHILRTEVGGIASVAGLFHRPVPGRRGVMDLDEMREMIRPGPVTRYLGTALISVETPHTAAGGAVLPLDHLAAVHALAGEYGIPLHMDGARIHNAATALGVEVADIARHADSVCFCVSKGLSAPVGSILVGSEAFIRRARPMRKMVGGAMRQAGVLAAAAIVALEEMTERLSDDHANARRLAEGLHGIHPSLADAAAVDINIVMVDLAASGRRADAWAGDFAERGLLANVTKRYGMRFLTHRHVDAADIDRALDIIAGLWRQRVSS